MPDKYTIRGVSEYVWRAAKAEASLLGIPLGRFVADALLAAVEAARKAREPAAAAKTRCATPPSGHDAAVILMERAVDTIHDGIRERLLLMAPKMPTDAEYEALSEEVANEHSYTVVRRGLDIEGRRFIQVRPR